MKRLLVGAGLGLALTCPAIPAAFDVVIYGATPGGATAAIAASREGRSVALLEPGKHVGGMISGGLGRTDMDRQQIVIGGLSREFFERVGKTYGQPISWFFEPHIAEQTLVAWLHEAGVQLFFDARLKFVTKKKTRITRVIMQDNRAFEASVYIDASYEGDLMRDAGISYAIGRESVTKYGESLAGRQDILPGPHQFRVPVSPYGRDGKLLPFITPQQQLVPTGQGDGHVQSYCFRICLTDNPANREPIPAPPGYDANRYGLVRNYLSSLGDSARLPDFLGISRLPHDKTDINSGGAVSTDIPSLSWQYPEANDKERQRIWEAHRDWDQGLLYFLSHDESVPGPIRKEMNALGFPKDEFADTGHWPYQLYVRDARRMLGDYVLTQHDLQENLRKADSIGMGGYNIDIREVQWIAHKVYRFPKAEDEVLMEGYLSMPIQPYEIPYRSLLPRREEASNLLVVTCISASAVAYASFRMEPQYMITGQSAGTAAALAVKNNVDLRHLNVAALQKTLEDHKQILHMPH
jgi:hypothetical protein